MRSLFRLTIVAAVLLLNLFSATQNAIAQTVTTTGGVKANFGVDADLYSNYLQFATGTADGTDDFFKNDSLTAGGTGVGLIDTAGMLNFRNIIVANAGSISGRNRTKVNRLNGTENSIINGKIVYDALYARDLFGINPTRDTSAINGAGYRNGANPTTWVTGPVTLDDEDDLVDVGAILKRQGPTTNDSLWFIGTSSMMKTNEDNHYVDFELFATEAVFTPGSGFSNTGSNNGHTAWTFAADGTPLTYGDVIFSFNSSNNGATWNVSTRIWVNQSALPGGSFAAFNGLANRPFTFTAVNTIGTGATPFGYAEITPRFVSNAAFARLNVSGATLASPWGTLQGGSATYSNTLAQLQMCEVAVNLTAMGLDITRYNAVNCFSFFGSILVKSRGGNSFTSDIEDFAGPYTFGKVSVFEANANGGRINCTSGNATLSVVSPEPVLTYTWTGPGSFSSSLASPTVTNAGTYNLRLTASGGCSAVDTAVVLAAPAVSISLTASVKTCQGSSSGSLTVNATGGTGPYTYSWSGGGSNATKSGLAPGSHAVTATDINGCSATATFNVETHPAILVALKSTNVFCQNLCAGTIDLTVISGTAPLTYLWSNGATTQDLTGLCVGSYTVTITDGNGCTATASKSITPFTTLVATVTTKDVTYNGSDGEAFVNASGGLPPYSYIWSNGATTALITGLSAGTYGVTVTDANNDEVSEVAIVEPAGLVKSGSFIVNMGVTPQTIANGLRPYGMIFDLVRNYNVPVKWAIRPGKQFDPLNNNIQTDFTYNGVDYKGGPFIIDAEYRTAAVNARITYWQSQGVVGVTTTSDIEVPVFDIITTFGNVVIDQQNEGLVTPYFTNAMIPSSIYTVGLPTSLDDCDDSYFLPHADPTWATHSNLRTFNINNRGFIWAGCHANSVLEGIFQPGNPAIRMNFLTTNGLQCYGNNDCGTLITETHDGDPTEPYIYYPSNGDKSIMQFLDDMTPSQENGSEQWYIPLTTGRWNPGVTIGVATSDGAAPRQGIKMAFGYGFDNPNNGLVMYQGGHTSAGRGTIQSQVAFQRAFFNFLFNSGIEKRLIINANIPTSYVTGVPKQVSVTVSSGSAPYTYQWLTTCGAGSAFANASAGTTTFTLGNLPPQSTCIITCIVTDACGRRNFVSVPVGSETPPPNPVLISINNQTNVTCFGACDGTIDVTVNGGFTPYTYIWSNGATTQDIFNLCPGDYALTVSDSIGCQQADTITISQPTELQVATSSVNNVLCNGQNNGSITLSVSGGTPGYTYLWSNGSTLQNISGLTAGNYSVSVRDSKNCLKVLSNIQVTQPNVLAASVDVLTNVSCFGGADGAITLTVSGGTTPYTYTWSNTQTTQNISNLSAGTYAVTVRDANNCSVTVTGITVTQPNLLTATVSSTTNVSCLGGNNGAINVTVAGGTTPYGYSWNNGATVEDLTGLTAGTYSLTVTDAKGCIATIGSIVITEPNQLSASVNVNTPVRCFGELNGSITLNVTGGTTPYTYFWSNNTTAASLTGVGAGTYSVTVSDANFCQSVLTGLVITEPALLTATLTSKQDELCSGTATGAIDVTVAGGNTPYSYLWSNSEITEDLTNIAGGTYSITVTDFKGCTATLGNIVVGTINCPPVAVNDTVSTNEDTPLIVPVLNNDSDPDGALNTATLQIITNPLHGTVTVNVNGTITYTPAANYYGPDQFSYVICDNGVPAPVLCDTALVLIDVISVNDPPIAVNDFTGTPENTLVNILVLNNDSDPDGALDNSTLVILSGSNNGVATVNNGTIDYTPNNGFNGNDTLFYRICDNGVPAPVLCDTARVVINVNSVNDPPIAVDDRDTTNEDTPVDITVLSNDNDPDGLIDPTSVVIISNPTHGNVTVNPLTGLVTYTPNADYYGADTFTYRVCDDGVPLPVLCDTATVYVTIVPVNDPPVVIPVLNNDTDPDGFLVPSTVTVTSSPSNGTVTVNPITGEITYTPNANYYGPDSFIYRVCDNGVPSPQLCDTALVVINVVSVNDPPVAVNDNATTNEDTPVNIPVLNNDTDPDGAIDPTSVVVVTNPLHGTVSVDPLTGVITYTPNANYYGNDTLTYRVCDNGVPAPVLCDTATVYIVVVPVNDPPVALPDNATTNEDTPVNIPVLNNDSDPDGAINTNSVTVTSNPTNGTVNVNPDGTVTYTPNPNYYGPDSFIYQVCDNGVPAPVLCDTALVSIIVTPVNDPPIAVNDNVTTPEDNPVTIPVLNNDSDPDGALDISTVVVVSPPTNGTTTVNPDGTITYTPNPNFYGNDTLQYRVCDNGVPAPSLCDTAYVYIVVTPVNDPPIANDDFATTDEDVPVIIPVLNNDSDPDGAINPTTVFVITNPSNGTVVVNPDGTVTYTPNANFNGNDSFVYRVCDNGVPSPVLCDTATVFINLNPVNDPPIANTDVETTPEDTPITVPVLNNDTDPDGLIVVNTLTVTDPPSNGTYTVNTNTGEITYIPNLNFYGTDTLIYQVCDNGVPSPTLCDTAFLIVTVTPVNDPPVAVQDNSTTAENNPVVITVLTNDYDVDGVIDVNSLTITDLPNHGTASVTPGGTITYTPNSGYNGLDTLIYQICDDGVPIPVLCDTAIVIINVLPVNDPPIAEDDFATTPEDTPVDINVPGNDSDPDGLIDLGSVVVVTPPSNGTTSVNPTTGVITYTPSLNFFGNDTFYYQICDDGVPLPVLCDQAMVVVVVTPVNDPPVAVDDNVSTDEDTPIIIPVTNNDYDVDGVIVPSSVTVVTPPTNGSVINNGNGTVTYIPGPNYNGNDSFVYSVCDNGLPVLCDTATVFININAVNDPPIAVNDFTGTGQGVPVDVDVKVNDSDVDGNIVPSSVTIVDQPNNGTATVNPLTGVVTYTPNPSFIGTDTLAYSICDDGTPLPSKCDTALVIINIANGPTVTAVVDSVSCFGLSDGSIDLIVLTGAQPFSYIWSPGGQTTQDISGLTAGTYSVTVTDNNGSTVSETFTVSQPALLSLAGSTSSNASCNGLDDADIDVVVNGGTSPYIYVWTNGATTQDLNNIGAGSYSVTVTDINTCSVSATYNVTEPQPLDATVTIIPVQCAGDRTGAIDLALTGGTAPYNIYWSTSATTEDITDLEAGQYQVYVSDANGCLFQANYTVIELSRIVISAGVTNVSCGGNDGEINLSISGGFPAYTYSWSNGSTTANLANIGPGAYTVTVTDSRGCTASQIIPVDNVQPLVVTTATTTATCGGTNGSVNLTIVQGSSANYTFNWSNGATSEDITGVSAGTYTVTITDARGCQEIISVTVTGTSPVIIIPTVNDANCGLSDGSIIITPAGGTIPYTYLWSNGAAADRLTGLISGVYSVTVIDANGCSAVQSMNVGNRASSTLTGVVQNTTCGQNDGSVTISVSGGVAPFTYNWSSGATTQNISGLGVGVFTVEVTDSRGCSSIGTFNVGASSGILVEADKKNVSCYAYNDGAIDVTVTGGTGNYTYLWSDTRTTQDINNLTGSNYSITVYDVNGCSATTNVNIQEPQPIVITEQITNVACNGSATGAIDISITGGSTPYQFDWSTGATTEDISGVVNGFYQVYVTDSNNCVAQVSYTISATSNMVLSTGVTNATCGQNNAQATVSVAGGVGPYSYEWSNGATTQTVAGLSPTIYQVTVTDALGCTATVPVLVDYVSDISVNYIVTDVICGVQPTGSIDLTVTGGTAPYTYLWNNGALVPDLNFIQPGTYTVTVTDATGCSSITSIFVDDIPSMVLAITRVDATCGIADGTATVSVIGGTPGYAYSWSTGESTAAIDSLIPGTYYVTVEDVNGCTVSSFVNMQNFTAPLVTLTVQNATCGNNNGSVTTSVSGGVTPYSYKWSNGATTADVSALAPGTYGITVTDANGCAAVDLITILPSERIIMVADRYNVTCNGLQNGSIDVTVTGGSGGNYTYLWSNGATTEDISNLISGVYDITVSDAGGCSATTSVPITQPQELTLTTQVEPVLCAGGSNGGLTLNINGGTPSYDIIWSTGDTTPIISGLTQGLYSVTVTDSLGCSATHTASVFTQYNLVVSSAVTNTSCGQSNGSLTISVTGGSGNYTYNWALGGSGTTQSNLAAGTYTVTVEDAVGCSVVQNIVVSSTSGLNVNVSVTNAQCSNPTTGVLSASVTGGTGPYTYLWSTGSTNGNISGLTPGSYFLTVTDATGCSDISEHTVGLGGNLQLAVNTTAATCQSNNGSATVLVANGTAPFTYSWSTTSQNTPTATGFAAGVYSVTVTDALGCSSSASFSVNGINTPSVSVNVLDNNCANGSIGAVDITLQGGIAPITFEWSNGATTEDISGLYNGIYAVTVTDSTNCPVVTFGTINSPEALILEADMYEVVCNGDSTGSVDVTVHSGATPYTYLWSNSATTEDVSNLASGSYDITVIDGNGCSVNTSVTVTEPDAIVGSVDTLNPTTCYNGFDGNVDVSVTGGVGPYTYNWSNGDTTQDLTGVPAGNYTLVITDSRNCLSDTLSVSVTEPDEIIISLGELYDASCNGSSDGSIYVLVSGGTEPYTYNWSNSETTQNITGLTAGAYSLTVVDGNGCSSTAFTDTVAQPDAIQITADEIVNVACSGANSGSIDISVTGGTAPYSYIWSTGATTEDISGLAVGTYDVTVLDANECSATASFTVTGSGPIDLSGTIIRNPTCIDFTDGSITVIADGGNANYTYLWSDTSFTGPVRDNLGVGTYNVTVTDGSNCTQTASFTLGAAICNLPPVANNDTVQTYTGGTIKIPVLTNDYDPDGDTISVTGIISDPTHGTVVINPDGTITYTSDSGYVGIDSFTYVICDNGFPQLCDSAVVYITVLPNKPNVFIPNGFSPNGDGYNDYWEIIDIDKYPNVEVLIFNRWGNKVYEAKPYQNEWDGTNENNEGLPDGTYYYIIKVNDDDNTVYTGYVVINRGK
jgi:gliding motility-associated-like protein